MSTRAGTQSGDCIEQFHSMPECCDAKLLQVLVRQAPKDRLIYLILAERCLVLPKAKTPQPNPDIHGGASAPHRAIILIETACLG